MYYKAKVNNLAPSSLDAPIFAISRDEKVNWEWKQVEYREDHVLEWKLTRVFYSSQDKYPKLNLRFQMDDGNTVIYKTWLGKTIRNMLYKLSAPEKIDRVTLKANRFDWKDKDGNPTVIRYVAVFVDWQKWDSPFDKDEPKIKPKVIESNWKFYGYDWDEVDKFIIEDLIPHINDKLVNKYEKKDEPSVPVERKNENPEDVLPF
jgi:hypothetical protein